MGVHGWIQHDRVAFDSHGTATRELILTAGPQTGDGGFRARGEGAVGDIAQALLENPLFSQALGKALGAGERAAQAQRAALGAFDVSSASDLERLSRRVRALSDRVEALEDTMDSLRRELAKAARTSQPPASTSS